MIENLTEAIFSRQLNTKFLLYPEPARPLDFELVEVASSAPQHERGGERFSLIFRGPVETYLPQSTYRMEHAEIGAFDLFIVPVRRDDAGLYYEAIFNRQT